VLELVSWHAMLEWCYSFYGNCADGSQPVPNYSPTTSRQINDDRLCQVNSLSVVVNLFCKLPSRQI